MLLNFVILYARSQGLDAIVFDLAAFNFNLLTFFHKEIAHSSLFSTDFEPVYTVFVLQVLNLLS